MPWSSMCTMLGETGTRCLYDVNAADHPPTRFSLFLFVAFSSSFSRCLAVRRFDVWALIACVWPSWCSLCAYANTYGKTWTGTDVTASVTPERYEAVT